MPTAPPLDFYADNALANPLAGTNRLSVPAPAASADLQLFVGSTAAEGAFKSALNPDVDSINVIISPSAEMPASSIVLASTQAGLDAATPGDPLSLGTSIAAGTVIEVWVRCTDANGVGGVYKGAMLSLSENEYYGV